jgi:hypothetical protein
MANSDDKNEKELLWKLAEYKRGQLFALLEKGMVKSHDEPQKIVRRQIFENLYNLKYKSDPEKWKNADYNAYCDKTIWAEVVEYDPNAIVLDEFATRLQKE